VGSRVGSDEGTALGENVGLGVDCPGKYVGANVGSKDGAVVGRADGAGVVLPGT